MNRSLPEACRLAYVVFSCLLMLAACDRPPVDYFPLDEGLYWRYGMSYQTMDGHNRGIYAIENMAGNSLDDTHTYIRKRLGWY